VRALILLYRTLCLLSSSLSCDNTCHSCSNSLKIVVSLLWSKSHYLIYCYRFAAFLPLSFVCSLSSFACSLDYYSCCLSAQISLLCTHTRCLSLSLSSLDGDLDILKLKVSLWEKKCIFPVFYCQLLSLRMPLSVLSVFLRLNRALRGEINGKVFICSSFSSIYRKFCHTHERKA
jgi:hypothetical protein